MVLQVSNLIFDTTETTQINGTSNGDIIVLVAGQEKIRVSPNGLSISANTLNVSGYFNAEGQATTSNLSTGDLTTTGANNFITGNMEAGNVSGAIVNAASVVIASNNYGGSLWVHVNTSIVSEVTSWDLQNLTPYKFLKITLSGMTMGNTNNAFFQLRFGSTAGTPLTTLFDSRAYASIASGNNMQSSAVTGQAKILLFDKNNTYANGISNAASAAGFAGTISISPFNTAQKTKVNSMYVFEDAGGRMQFAAQDGQHSAQTIMNGIFISANTNSTRVPTFSGTIIVEGIMV